MSFNSIVDICLVIASPPNAGNWSHYSLQSQTTCLLGQISVPIVFREPNGAVAGVGAQYSKVLFEFSLSVCIVHVTHLYVVSLFSPHVHTSVGSTVSWCPQFECAVSGQMLSSRKETGFLCNCWRRPGKGGFDVILTQNQITGTRRIKLEFEFQIPGCVITLFLYANTKGENVTFWSAMGLGITEQQYFGMRCV